MILLATWGGLRFGELAGLTRADFDLAARTVRVSRQVQELADGRLLTGPPKTDAGRRTIAIPPHVIPDIKSHLAKSVGADAVALVFLSPTAADYDEATSTVGYGNRHARGRFERSQISRP